MNPTHRLSNSSIPRLPRATSQSPTEPPLVVAPEPSPVLVLAVDRTGQLMITPDRRGVARPGQSPYAVLRPSRAARPSVGRPLSSPFTFPTGHDRSGPATRFRRLTPPTSRSEPFETSPTRLSSCSRLHAPRWTSAIPKAPSPRPFDLGHMQVHNETLRRGSSTAARDSIRPLQCVQPSALTWARLAPLLTRRLQGGHLPRPGGASTGRVDPLLASLRR
jgi:hypothetical protein